MRTVLILFGCVLLGTSLGFATTITDGGGTVTFTASNGSGLSAEAMFTLSGGTLTIVLTNTGSPAVVPADGLTGLFWNSLTTLSTTGASATITGGSSLLNCTGATPTCTPSTNVGGEFAYASSGFPSPFNQGISSAGFSIFGSGNLNGSNLQDPNAVDGINFALVNGLAGNANNKITGVPTIDNSVTFVFTGLSSTLDLTNVGFQYGTVLTDPNLKVAEPGSLALLVSGLFGLVGLVRKRYLGRS